MTGATGLLGSAVIFAARERGLNVVATARRSELDLPGIEWRSGDLTDAGFCEDLMRAASSSWVIHCAAETSVDWCEDHPVEAQRVNEGATRTVARAAAQIGARLVYISTDSVFDGRSGMYRETDDPAPVNAYARSKLCGERAVLEEMRDAGLVLRTTIYGWNAQPKESLGEWLLRRLRAGIDTDGFTDVVFTPLVTDDLAEIILDLIDVDARGLYHAASRDAMSKFAFGALLAEVFDLDPACLHPISIDVAPLRAVRPKDTSLVSEKLQRKLGRGLPSVRDGLDRFRSLAEAGRPAQLKALYRRRDA